MKLSRTLLSLAALAFLSCPRAEAHPAVAVGLVLLQSTAAAVQTLKTGLDLAREQYCGEIRQIIDRTKEVSRTQSAQRIELLKFAKDFDQHTIKNLHEEVVDLYATMEKHRQKGKEAYALCSPDVQRLNVELDGTAQVVQINAGLLKANIGSEIISDNR